jgi:hypothetical protein
MSTTQASEVPHLVADLVSVSSFLLKHKPSHPEYRGHVQALKQVKAAIAAFDPVALVTAADPQDRRDIYQRHISAGGTLRDVANDLGLAYTTVHSYAKRYFPSLIEHSRTNSRRLASKRLSERLNGGV